MKEKNLMFIFLSVFLFSCCNLKVEVELPENFNHIQGKMRAEKYKEVIELLDDENIPDSQKVDWYYYDYAVSLYKTNPMNVRNSIPMMKEAHKFNPHSYEINYYLGLFYYDISNYKKSYRYFSKCGDSEKSERFPFNEKIEPDFWCQVINILFFDKTNVVKENKLDETTGLSYLNRMLFHENFFLEKILNDGDLSLREKILCSECYFYLSVNSENLDRILNFFELYKTENNEIYEYLKSKKVFLCILKGNLDNIMGFLQENNKNGFLLLTSSEPIVNELFYKYLAFYYYKIGDGLKANNCIHIFNRYHFKPTVQKDKLEYELKNIEARFKNDKEFKLIR